LVEEFLERLSILDWSDDVTFHYARIRSALERAGTPIGNMDLLIASHAVSEHSTLVTNNVRHFSHVPGLKIEEWK
jgi:tRNA(fMet)-specific endonuclease VapC